MILKLWLKVKDGNKNKLRDEDINLIVKVYDEYIEVEKYANVVAALYFEKEFPVLTLKSNIIVMADEAHRSQYRGTAENMRDALPNAVFIGFTGTPIDKTDVSTQRTFGSYIDKYGIKESVDDGATVKIVYEGRKPEHWKAFECNG